VTRYIVIGAGAVGVTVAAELQAIGRDVVVVGRGQQLELLREGKLRYFRPDGDRLLHLAAAAGPQDVRLAPTDVLVLATKTQQAAAAISEWAWQPVAGTDREAGEVVPILTLQNGLDVERSALRGFATVVGSVLWTSATYTADGEVVTPSAPAAGVFWLGPYPDGPASAAAGTISADLEVAGFEVQVVEDLSRWKAAKLLSSVTFVLDALYSKSPDRDRAADLVRTEAAQILAAAGLDVADIPAESTIRFDRFSSRPIEGRSRGGNSTWQSLTRHRDIETDFLNGEIVLLARLLGRRAPLSEAFLARVHVVARHGTSPGSLPVEDLLDVLARATAPVDAEFAATGALPA
jgi:thiosulfate/3-mercaptopyruvate sulfurtransferase